MDMPKDPIILLSYVNTKLRDDFSSLDDMCKSLGTDRQELENTLSAVGYVYDKEKNCFRAV